MKDIQDRLERLSVEAIECDLIAGLAIDPAKRKTFERLAREYRAMADGLQADASNFKERIPPTAG
jgi:hypothetical protein